MSNKYAGRLADREKTLAKKGEDVVLAPRIKDPVAFAGGAASFQKSRTVKLPDITPYEKDDPRLIDFYSGWLYARAEKRGINQQ